MIEKGIVFFSETRESERSRFKIWHIKWWSIPAHSRCLYQTMFVHSPFCQRDFWLKLMDYNISLDFTSETLYDVIWYFFHVIKFETVSGRKRNLDFSWNPQKKGVKAYVKGLRISNLIVFIWIFSGDHNFWPNMEMGGAYRRNNCTKIILKMFGFGSP